jgi:hypothetical protein
MSDLLEVWVNTGEVIQRDRTPAEQAQYEADVAATAQAEADRVAAEQSQVALRASAEAKLAALGLTLDEISTVLP